MGLADLLSPLKINLRLGDVSEDAQLTSLLEDAVSYAENYQHTAAGFYEENAMSGATRRAVLMLASHFYESPDGSTGGFFGDSVAAGDAVYRAVNRLLDGDRVLFGEFWQDE